MGFLGYNFKLRVILKIFLFQELINRLNFTPGFMNISNSIMKIAQYYEKQKVYFPLSAYDIERVAVLLFATAQYIFVDSRDRMTTSISNKLNWGLPGAAWGQGEFAQLVSSSLWCKGGCSWGLGSPSPFFFFLAGREGK